MPAGKKKAPSSDRCLSEYCETLQPETRAVIARLDGLIRAWQPQLPVEIWHSMGFPIIGYGRATYQSGGKRREWLIVGLAAHRSYFSLYVWGIWQGRYLLEAYAGRLGNVKVGKACLNFKAVSDLDLRGLRELVGKAVALQTTGQSNGDI